MMLTRHLLRNCSVLGVHEAQYPRSVSALWRACTAAQTRTMTVTSSPGPSDSVKSVPRRVATPAAAPVAPPVAAVSSSRAALGTTLAMSTIAWPWAAHVLDILPEGLTATSLVFASFGSSACLVFALPASPLARPKAVVLGHVLSALSGGAAGAVALTANLSPHFSVPVGVGLAVASMMAGRVVHPPAAGTAVIAALSPLGLHVVVPFVAVQGILMCTTAAVYGRLLKGWGPYPLDGKWWI